jgi:NAD(P)-dependent dehydrogenase (short-subunit alcohol dehydrogenase family)
VKLALHYFRRQFAQNPDASKDQLLVLQSSVAGYLDIPRSVQYNMSKFGMRAVMRVLRWTEHNHGIRVNTICPWYPRLLKRLVDDKLIFKPRFIHTAIIPPEGWKLLESNGLEYAKVEDVAQALLKLASDPTINGELHT